MDSIYGSSFAMMVKESFRDDKNFIVAKMKSRGTANFKAEESNSSQDYEEESREILKQEGKIISNHFNIYSVLKILFRKKGQTLVGRYDKESSLPMTALNPLTNNRIVGEVEFFFIENPYLKIEPKEDRYPKNRPLSLSGCKGVFIGSDYSYCNSPNLVQTIKDNCLSNA